MKKLFFTLVFLGFCISVSAQSEPQVGDTFIIKAQNGAEYNHIDFPKLNILTKRGKVANYKSVHRDTVVVDELITKDGKTYVMLKQKDGSKFFGMIDTVKANFNEALSSNELSEVK